MFTGSHVSLPHAGPTQHLRTFSRTRLCGLEGQVDMTHDSEAKYVLRWSRLVNGQFLSDADTLIQA